MSRVVHAAFAIAATLAVGAAVVWGFVLAGSPATRRLQVLDERRVRDLKAISSAIQFQVKDWDAAGSAPSKKVQLKAPLPNTLEEVAQNDRLEKLSLRDPETGEPYGYTVVNPTTFKLCAKFSRAHNADFEIFWNHPAGEHCFTIDVLDPPP